MSATRYLGARPQESKGTVVRIPLKLEADGDSHDLAKTWNGTTTVINEKTMTVSVTSPEDASVGRYEIFVESKLVGKEAAELNRYEHEDTFIMLFNSWCPGRFLDKHCLGLFVKTFSMACIVPMIHFVCLQTTSKYIPPLSERTDRTCIETRQNK